MAFACGVEKFGNVIRGWAVIQESIQSIASGNALSNNRKIYVHYWTANTLHMGNIRSSETSRIRRLMI